MSNQIPYLPPNPPNPHVSERYRMWLTIAMLLSLATITLSAVVVIITNARERDREEDFDLTLTAVWRIAGNSTVAPAQTSTPAPVITPGVFPFAANEDSPTYSAAESCDTPVLTGQIIDASGSATDEYQVRIWGDFMRVRSVFTGDLANESPGVWTLTLTDRLNRRLWVQVSDGDRTLSAPVEIVFNGADCERNRAEVLFVQVAPVE